MPTKPRVNDLDCHDWRALTEGEDALLTDSLWLLDSRDNSGGHKDGGSYHGNFVPQIPRQLLRRYTKPGEWVLDPFCGGGTTLVEARRLGRHALGLDLSAEALARADTSLQEEPNPYQVCASTCQADSTRIPLLEASVQFVLYHPPYHDIVRFSEGTPGDLSCCASVDGFLALWGKVLDNTLRALEPGRHCAVVIGDYYRDGEWVRLGSRVMDAMEDRGLVCESVIVKNYGETKAKGQNTNIWKYRSLNGGFFVFRHEYIGVYERPVPKRPRASRGVG